MTTDGAEMQLLKTLERLNQDRFEAFVVLSRTAGERYDQLAKLPIVQEITVLHDERRSAISSLIEKAFKLAGIVKAVQPSIIHSWLWYSNFLCGLVRQFSVSSHIPLIVSQRGDYHARYGRVRLWLTEKIIYRHADLILTNSDRIQANLQNRYPGKRIVAIRNLINLPESQKAVADGGERGSEGTRERVCEGAGERGSVEARKRGSEGVNYCLPLTTHHSPLTTHHSPLTTYHSPLTTYHSPLTTYHSPPWRIVSVGRLAPEKGHQYLIQALARLNTDFTATLLGDGELKAELGRLAEHHHLSERIQLPGFCPDVFPLLSNAHLFVLPSLHESSPNALIEAMGMGLPCIASAVGGVLDLIEDGQSGLLVPPAAPDALARAIHRLLEDRALAERLGANATRKILQMFDNARSIRQLEAAYRECLGICNPPPANCNHAHD